MRKKNYLVNFKNRENDKGKRNNPTHFIFFDTETRQDTVVKKIGKKEYKTVINKLDLGWACYWNRETDEEEWIDFDDLETFYEFLSRVCTKSGKKQLWIIAHNIVFDAIIMDLWGWFQDKKYESDFIHAKGMVFIQCLKRYSTKLDKHGKRKMQKKIMLVNNGNLFPAKLETIGETIGLKKMEVDFKVDSREYIHAYCKRDVEILVVFWKQWTKFIESNNLGNIKYTISSQSMESFKKRFCDKYIVLDDDLDNLGFERKGYYGGRTEIFYKGKVKNPVYYYDVNSMYPHVMKNFRYPIEFKFWKKNPTLNYITHMIEKGYLLVAECYINTENNNCYPLKIKGSLCFPVGKFQTVLCTPEIIEGIKNGDIEKFGRVSFYTGDYIFSEYIDFFYNKRLELKKAKNKQEAMYKLFLNSLYGKFGQMMDSWIKIEEDVVKMMIPDFDLTEWMMDNFQIPKILLGGKIVSPHLRFIGNELQISGEQEESNISFPAIAGHVTSYARLIIWEGMKWAKENNTKIFYCDTDSMFLDKELPENLVDEKELGKFKVEHYYPHGVEFINLKNYCPLSQDGNKVVENEKGEMVKVDDETFLNDTKIFKGNKWKMKGVSNNAEMVTETEFIVQEWAGLPKQQYYTKFGRRKGEFWVIYKHKKNHDNINKGLKAENGDILPFNLNEW